MRSQKSVLLELGGKLFKKRMSNSNIQYFFDKEFCMSIHYVKRKLGHNIAAKV
jgi:hypothetical protein